MTDDLNTLLPLSRNVIVKSETLTIEPFLFRDIKKVSGYVAVFRDNMVQGEDGDASLLDIAIQHSEEILEVIGLATGRDAAWCDKLDVVSVLELLGAIIEVNLDFFSRLLFPRIKEMVEKIGGGAKLSRD
jgi:hypothetical protein